MGCLDPLLWLQATAEREGLVVGVSLLYRKRQSPRKALHGLWGLPLTTHHSPLTTHQPKAGLGVEPSGASLIAGSRAGLQSAGGAGPLFRPTTKDAAGRCPHWRRRLGSLQIVVKKYESDTPLESAGASGKAGDQRRHKHGHAPRRCPCQFIHLGECVEERKAAFAKI